MPNNHFNYQNQPLKVNGESRYYHQDSRIAGRCASYVYLLNKNTA